MGSVFVIPNYSEKLRNTNTDPIPFNVFKTLRSTAVSYYQARDTGLCVHNNYIAQQIVFILKIRVSGFS